MALKRTGGKTARIVIYSLLGLVLIGFIVFKILETQSVVNESNSTIEEARSSTQELDQSMAERVDDGSSDELDEAQVPSEPVKFKGSGHTATAKFDLSEGLVTAKLTYTGDSNFAVELLNDDGELVEMLANEIGTSSFSRAFRVESDGSYLLNVTAEGDWSVELTQ